MLLEIELTWNRELQFRSSSQGAHLTQSKLTYGLIRLQE